MNRKPVSVCMATYNGDRFVKEQIDSILHQLSDDDELVVVDDCSTDDTVSIIRGYEDSRVLLHVFDKNRGHVAAFSEAVSLSRNEIIFFSDQDDVWVNGRLDEMSNLFLNKECFVLSSNSYYINCLGEEIQYVGHDLIRYVDQENNIKNVLGVFWGECKYFGCAMAFSRNVIDIVLPIPKYVESHDLWVVFIGNMIGGNRHFEGCTLYRRIHGNNASIVNRPLHKKIISRFIFIRMLIEIALRILKKSFKNYVYRNPSGRGS